MSVANREGERCRETIQSRRQPTARSRGTGAIDSKHSDKPGPRTALAIEFTALSLVIAAFLLSAMQAASRNPNVAQGDQNSYLRLALRVAEVEGFANGNYHPLLALVLSPIASRDWQFFSDAKLVNIALAAGALVLAFALARKLYGPLPALFATAVLALNHEYLARAGRTEPEALLTGLFFAAWALWVLSLDRPRLAWLAGAVAGLAYLAKGTGQFLLISYLLYALAIHGPRRWLSRPLAAFVIAYLVAAAPLLITNWRAFGSPFYAFPSTHAMWYDEWDDRYRSVDGRHITLRTYVTTHSLTEAGTRLTEGAAEMPEQWLGALELDPAPARRPIPLALLAALAGLWIWCWLAQRRSNAGHAPGAMRATRSEDTTGAKEQGSNALAARPGNAAHSGYAARQGNAAHPSDAGPDPARVGPDARALRHGIGTFGLLFGLTFVFFAWYAPIAASPRFFLPLVPIALLLAAAALDRAAARAFAAVGGSGTYRIWSACLLPVGIALAAAIAIAQTPRISRAEIRAADRDFNAAAIAVLEEVKRRVPSGGTVVWGPGNLATWTTHGQLTFRPVPPEARSLADLEAFMREIGATTVIMAPDMVREREAVFAPYFHYEDKQTVRIDAIPPGWQLIGSYPDERCRYCLFEVQR
jgi:4-amino-4-deoxy-L-arabinose transferase-like glycosyltransferase